MTFKTIHDAYLYALEDVYNNPDYVCSPRGVEIREKLNYTFTVLHPTSGPIVTKDTSRNEVIAQYLTKEKELYSSGTLDAARFAEASKFWLKISNPDGTINSNYGYLVFNRKSEGGKFTDTKVRTPWEWAKLALETDKDSRQAIIRFNRPEHLWNGNKDIVCTMHGIFHIREDRLNLSIVMRSNDLIKGLAYDISYFCGMIDTMIHDLRPTYPNLKKGVYTHTAHSLHVYARDYSTLLKMIGQA